MPSPAQSFQFLDDPNAYQSRMAFVARLRSGIEGKAELLDLLYRRLGFPDYFGFNWDALSDCLRDFHWVTQAQIVIVHEDLPGLPDADLRIYLPILADAVVDWQQSDEHTLEVVFPETARTAINSLFQ